MSADEAKSFIGGLSWITQESKDMLIKKIEGGGNPAKITATARDFNDKAGKIWRYIYGPNCRPASEN